MKKLLFSLGIFILTVLLTSFSFSGKEQMKTSEVVDFSMKLHSEQETNFLTDILSSNYTKDTTKIKAEDVDFYEINITVKLPSGEEAGFFQNSISSKYTADKKIWEKWTTSTSGAHNHTKVLEKLEKVLRKY